MTPGRPRAPGPAAGGSRPERGGEEDEGDVDGDEEKGDAEKTDEDEDEDEEEEEKEEVIDVDFELVRRQGGSRTAPPRPLVPLPTPRPPGAN